MFLALCNEAFHYTHEQILDSGMALIMGMLQEHGYMLKERNKAFSKKDDEDEGEYIDMIDFDTGETKRIKKVDKV